VRQSTPSARAGKSRISPRYTPARPVAPALNDLRGRPLRKPLDPETRLTSNVAQSYPYTTETEAERVAAIERATAQFDGLAKKIADESTPVGEPGPDEPGRPNRSWVFICPLHVPARLHVAGYARERHALYVVCDEGGETYLR